MQKMMEGLRNCNLEIYKFFRQICIEIKIMNDTTNDKILVQKLVDCGAFQIFEDILIRNLDPEKMKINNTNSLMTTNSK